MNESKKIRSFIALELSQEARAELSRVENILKRSGANVKWVRPESIHVTLKFLGYITEDKVDPISKKLEEIASQTSPFDIVLSGIGAFPGWSHARVVWVGISEGAEQVKTIAGLVEKAMAEEGFEEENRPFKSHLTIGRVRSSKEKEALAKDAEAIEVKPVSNHISRIILFRSELTPEGAIYTPLHIAEFSV
ncbi:MAG: RNA 2',3'-cyclic phosphodiesterase [Candidatus Omnitrophota bacterium]